MYVLNNRVYINVRTSMNDCAKIIEMAGENNGMVTASSVSKAGLQWMVISIDSDSDSSTTEERE